MIASVVAGFKNAFELIKKINEISKSVEINNITIVLQSIVLDAQARIGELSSENFSLTDKIRTLEKEIDSMKDWSDERQNYELQEWRRGIFAYVNKKLIKNDKNTPRLCATCFDNGNKSILQSSHFNMITSIKCQKCGFSADIF